MKNNFIVLMLLLNSCLTFSQIENVVLSYTVSPAGTVNVYASTTSGSANVNGFNFGFYYKNAEVSIPGVSPFSELDPAGAAAQGWSTGGNFTTNVQMGSFNVGSQVYDRLVTGQVSDGNGAGSTISTTPVLLVQLKFTSVDGSLNDNLVVLASSLNPGAEAFVITGDGFTTSTRVVTAGVIEKALPITLKTFTAERYGNARAVILNWTSSSEINGSHFDVERSLDAQSWSKIGTVNAVGNTTTETSYEFIDRTIDQARTNPEVVYYRLNKVDLDGSSEYTDIRTVHFDPVADVALSVYPSLTTGLVRIDIASPAHIAPSAPAVLYDKTGKIVTRQEVSTNGITELDLAKYTNGSYFIKVEINNKLHTTQIIKVN